MKTLLTLRSPAALTLNFHRLFCRVGVCVWTFALTGHKKCDKKGKRHRSRSLCVCMFVCMCVQLLRRSQIGPQKTPSDVSGQYGPLVRLCVWASGASVLCGTMVIRTTGGRPDRQGAHVCACVCLCVFDAHLSPWVL